MGITFANFTPPPPPGTCPEHNDLLTIVQMGLQIEEPRILPIL